MGSRDTGCDARAAVTLAAGAFVLLVAGRAQAVKTYFIDESTDYTGNGCENTDLNTVTYALQSWLVYDGWDGQRWVNPDAWPQDWREACSSSTYGPGGLDVIYADTRAFAVFAGHSGPGDLVFGYPHDGVCDTYFQANMRLGSMAGGTPGNLGAHAAIGMWLGCDTLTLDSLPTQANWQWLRQQLGFRNVVGIDDYDPAWVFYYTGPWGGPAMSNADAWLQVMDGSGRQPIVVSYGTSADDCWNTHFNAKLGSNTLIEPRDSYPKCAQGQPAFTYCYWYI